MIVDQKRIKKYGLEKYVKDIDNIENQYLNLIYDRNFDHVVEKWLYERTISLMPWKCAICGNEILVDKKRGDVENFVCDKCKEQYNNKNLMIDRRILDSRTRVFKWIEEKLYEELEDSLKVRK
jgi:transposase-like protein